MSDRTRIPERAYRRLQSGRSAAEGTVPPHHARQNIIVPDPLDDLSEPPGVPIGWQEATEEKTMLIALIASIIGSAGMAYADGLAFVAERGSELRSKRAILWLVLGTLTFVPLPPQLILMGDIKLGGDVAALGMGAAFSFPRGFVAGPYWVIWIVTTLLGAAVGARLWMAGQPGWRDTSGALDTSAAGRARGLLVMCDSLGDAADTIVRVRLDAKGAEALSRELEDLGRRLARTLPAESKAVYDGLVSGGVPIAVAGTVTRHLVAGRFQVS